MIEKTGLFIEYCGTLLIILSAIFIAFQGIIPWFSAATIVMPIILCVFIMLSISTIYLEINKRSKEA